MAAVAATANAVSLSLNSVFNLFAGAGIQKGQAPGNEAGRRKPAAAYTPARKPPPPAGTTAEAKAQPPSRGKATLTRQG